MANLSAQTSSDMPAGGQVLKRSGMEEEGEASRAVNSSAISATVTCFMITGNRPEWGSTHTNIEELEKSPTVAAPH